MKYYLLPHPFKENENVIFGNLDIDKKVWDDFNNPKSNIPIVERTVIATKEINNLEALVKDYEKNFNKKNLDLFSKAKFNIYSNLGVALSASYLLYYCTPESVTNIVNNSLGFIGDPFIGTLAKVSLCAIPAAFSLATTVGIPVVGNLLGIGTKNSKVYRLNELEKPYKEKKRLINLFGTDIKERLVEDMKDLSKQFEGTETGKVFETVYSSISQQPFISTTEATLDNVIHTAEKEKLPFGKIQQLKDMKEDVLAHMKNDFKFAQIKEEYSNKQAENLKKFLQDSQELRHNTIKEYNNLKKGNKESLSKITTNLEKLYGYVSRYDFGDTSNVNDRGFLKDFYYGLYTLVGKEDEKFRKGRKVNTGNLEYKLNKFMNVNQRSKLGEWIKSKFGKIMAIIILAGTMMASNVHTISPTEYLNLHIRQPGYKQMIGERSEIITYDDASFKIGNKKIVWALPKPLILVYKTDTNKVYDVDTFYPMKEYIPKNLWNKVRNFWAGQYGTGYEGINFNVEYKVKDDWKTFNADGRGTLRLEQIIISKTQEHIEEQSKDFRESIYTGSPEERIKITKHLSKMLKEGKFEDKLSPLIYPSPFSRLSYGSTYERYSLGMEYLKNIAEEKKLDDLANLINIESEKVKSAVKTELQDIRLNPLEFKRLINNLDDNYYELLHRYPELIMNLYHYSLQDYMQEQTMEMIRKTYEAGKEDVLTKGLLEKLQKDEDLSKLVEIKNIDKSIVAYCGIALNNYINRTKNLL